MNIRAPAAFRAAREALSSFFPLPHPMPFDHERLDVYQRALEFFDLADDIIENLPRGRGHLADQLTRAALSIVNNIAEGAGKFSKATESAAMLDVCLRRKLISDHVHRRGKQILDRATGTTCPKSCRFIC